MLGYLYFGTVVKKNVSLVQDVALARTKAMMTYKLLIRGVVQLYYYIDFILYRIE